MRIALVGCGNWGFNYVRVLSEIEEAKLAYVADPDEENMSRVKREGVKKLHDYGHALSDPELDAAIIATPSKMHFKIAKDFLQAGKHVLVEKPMVLNSKDGEELIRIANESHLNLMVNHTFEYNPGIWKLKGFMSSGMLGRIYNMTARRLSFGPIRQDINCMWDFAPHDIATANYLLGKLPIGVHAVGASYIKRGIEDVVFITLMYPRNIIFNIEVNWLSPYKIRELKVVGSERMVIFDDMNKVEPLRVFDKGVKASGNPEESQYSSYTEHQLIVREGGITIPKIKQSEPLKNVCLEFVSSIKEKRKPKTDGLSGLRVVKILEKAQESLKKSAKVPITW